MRIRSGAGQWVGALVLLVWTGLVVFALPRVAAAIPAEEAVAAGTSIAVGGIGITPAEGWGQPKDVTGVLILRKGGAQITAPPPSPAAGDLAAVLDAQLAGFRADTATGWKVSEPASFTTAEGLDGLYAIAVAPQQFLASYVVVKDGKTYLMLASGTDSDWTALHDELLDMAKTIDTTGGAS